MALAVENPPVNAGNIRCSFHPWVGKIPWRGKWQPTAVFLPGESHGQRSWQATVHGVAKELDTQKSWTRLSDWAYGTQAFFIEQFDNWENREMLSFMHKGVCTRTLIVSLVQKTVSNLNAHKKGKFIQKIENNLFKKRTFKINKWMNIWNSTQVLK